MHVKYLYIYVTYNYEEIFEVTKHTCLAYVIPIKIVSHTFNMYVKVQWRTHM